MQKISADAMPLYAVPDKLARQFIEWIWGAREKTCFDFEVLTYPRSCMTVAKLGDEVAMMIPLQPVLMFESMVRKPGLTDRQSAMCLYRISKVVEKAMGDTGHREAYFLTNVAQEAETASHHGWTKALYDPEKQTWLMKRKTEAVEVAKDTKCS